MKLMLIEEKIINATIKEEEEKRNLMI